jgi:hypothetical protein
MHDIIIRNGLIVDGTGSEGFIGDIAIDGDRITKISASIDEKGLKLGETKQKLKKWFWCSVLSQKYETSPNSQSAKDVAEIELWINGGNLPQDIASFSFEPEMLYEVTPRQRALYRGVICLILSRHPKDFYELKMIDKDLMMKLGVDDHHIFPDAYLKDTLMVKESKHRDCILNRTLIDARTNRELSKTDPKTYFNGMLDTLKEPTYRDLLNSHVIPAENRSTLLDNDYEGFLKWRCAEIGKLIKEVTS